MKEQWRPIHGYTGKYEVSNLGDVRSLLRFDGERKRFCKRKTPLIVFQQLKHDYLYVKLYKDGRFKNKRVHRLVLRAFSGPSKWPKVECAHLDANRINNVISNLRWATRKENESHKYESLHREVHRGFAAEAGEDVPF